MVSNNLFWEEHVTPRWVELFDKIVVDSYHPDTQLLMSPEMPVIKGDMV
jgi:hypothetical protein